VKLVKVGETPTQFVLKDEDTGILIRVPKDAKAIPKGSVVIGTEDVTKDVKAFVRKLARK